MFISTDFTVSFKHILIKEGKMSSYMGVNKLKKKKTNSTNEEYTVLVLNYAPRHEYVWQGVDIVDTFYPRHQTGINGQLHSP
jgi:hypothetical protein